MRKFALIAVGLLLIAGTAYSEKPEEMEGHEGMMGHHPGMGMMGRGGMEMMNDDGPGPMMGLLRGIELTDEQRATLDKMRLDNERKMIERRSTMVDLGGKLKLAITADKFSQKDVDEIAAKMGKFHEEGITMHVANVRAIRDILTPEQRVRFDQNILSEGPGMGKGMGMGREKHGWLGMFKGKKCGPGGCD